MQGPEHGLEEEKKEKHVFPESSIMAIGYSACLLFFRTTPPLNPISSFVHQRSQLPCPFFPLISLPQKLIIAHDRKIGNPLFFARIPVVNIR